MTPVETRSTSAAARGSHKFHDPGRLLRGSVSLRWPCHPTSLRLRRVHQDRHVTHAGLISWFRSPAVPPTQASLQGAPRSPCHSRRPHFRVHQGLHATHAGLTSGCSWTSLLALRSSAVHARAAASGPEWVQATAGDPLRGSPATSPTLVGSFAAAGQRCLLPLVAAPRLPKWVTEMVRFGPREFAGEMANVVICLPPNRPVKLPAGYAGCSLPLVLCRLLRRLPS